jgi:hypothetical protein
MHIVPIKRNVFFIARTFLVLFILSMLSSIASAEEAGYFSRVQGRVDVLKPGATSTVPARVNDIVSTGDIVRTKSDGRATIAFKDNSTLNIAPESRVSIDEYAFTDGTRKNAAMSLFRGKVRAIVSKGGLGILPVAEGRSDFTVKTPTGVMGVKGTDVFVFFYSGVTGVIFREGSGFLFNPAVPEKIVDVSAGFLTHIMRADSAPMLPRKATDAELGAHIRHTTITTAVNEDGEVRQTAVEEEAGGEGEYAEEPGELGFQDIGFSAEEALLDEGGIEGPELEEGLNIEGEQVAEAEVPFTETEEEAIDDEAPQTSFVQKTGYVTSSPEAYFNVSSNEVASYSYRLDGGALTPTGPDIYLTGLSEGLHTLEVVATDNIGNTSATTYSWFYGARHFNLYGSLEGDEISGDVSGELVLTYYGNTGAWALNITGETPSSGGFSAKGGGLAYNDLGYVYGYWHDSLMDASADTEEPLSGYPVSVSGSSEMTFMSLYSLSTGAGQFSGSANEETYEVTDAGLGALTETALTYVSSIYTEAYNFYGELAYFHSLMGGTQDLWSSSVYDPAETIWIGEFSMPDYGAFLMAFGSYNFLSYTDTTYDNGSYYGFMAGSYTDSGLDTKAYFLYIDPDGGSGVIRGSFSTDDEEGFLAQGGLYPVEITGSIGVPSSYLTSYIVSRYYNTTSGDFWFNSLSLGPSYGRDFTLFSQYSSIGVSDWGVWNARVKGSFDGVATTDSWRWLYEYKSSDLVYGYTAEGSKWSEGEVIGTTLGYVADAANAQTWITAGDALGTFDPDGYTYDVAMTGVYLDTRRFLAMTQTSDGQGALAGLNIPYAEVGRANLTGTDGNLSVDMNDVIFFAYSSGATPQIWATQNVSGTYVTTPSAGTVVGLTGSGLSADFTTQSWADSRWSASILGSGAYSGSGTMNGSSIQFRGGAAGPYGSGSFTGTGSGIVR